MFREDVEYQIDIPRPTDKQRREYWEVAKGLQAVDGLKTSKYAESVAQRYIVGELSSYQMIEEIDAYHNDASVAKINGREDEADKVSARMVAALEDLTFSFSPAMLLTIHATLFDDVFPKNIVGKFRNANITKSEAVLGGKSVTYGDYRSLRDTLTYDFHKESGRHYSWPFSSDDIQNLARFVSSIWQVHPFFEGNTRTTALFLQLYLRSIGISVDNTMFRDHSDYFRDALVRSNYADIPAGIYPDFSFLNAFLENLICGANNDLTETDLVITKLT